MAMQAGAVDRQDTLARAWQVKPFVPHVTFDAAPEIPSFSRKDAKLLARLVAEWHEPDQQGTSEKFWLLLLPGKALSAEESNQLLTLIVKLFTSGDSFHYSEFAATQAAAARLVEHRQPGLLQQPGPHVIRSTKTGLSFCLCACRVSIRWRFLPLSPDSRVLEAFLDPCLRPPSPHYLPRTNSLSFLGDDDQVYLEQGAAVHVRLMNFRQRCKRFQKLCEGDEDFVISRELFRLFGHLDLPGCDLRWIKQLVKSGTSCFVFKKCLGLTHPDRPFAVSSAVIVLDDAQDVQQMVQVAWRLDHDFLEKGELTIPFAFPAFISDADLRLQRAHLMLAAGCVGASEAAMNASQVVASELLGDSTDLVDVDLDDLRRHLASVDELVREALEALRATQCARKASELACIHIIDTIIDQAWSGIKVRSEWRAREAKVRSWAHEARPKRTKNKSRRKAQQVQMASSNVGQDTVHQCKGLGAVVQELQRRTTHYRHTARGMVSLLESGLAQLASDSPEVTGEDEGCSQLLLEITPPMSDPDASSTSGRKVACLATRRPAPHFMQVLEAACARDRTFALAHAREKEWKLKIQEDLQLKQALQVSAESGGLNARSVVPDELAQASLVDIESSGGPSTFLNISSVANTDASVNSTVSAGNCGPKCFLEGSLLKMASKMWCPVENIKSAQWALSCDGQEIQVKKATKYEQKQVTVVELETETPSVFMAYTDNHRVLTPHGERLAGELVEGDLVMVATSATSTSTATWATFASTQLPVPLKRVEHRGPFTLDVYELVFDPDEPVEAFLEPVKKMLSKGTEASESAQSKNMNRRQRKAKFFRALPAVTPDGSDNEPALSQPNGNSMKPSSTAHNV